MRQIWIATFLALALACSGGGGGSASGGGSVPDTLTLSALTLTPAGATVGQGGGSVTVQVSVAFSAPAGDLATVTFSTANSSFSSPVQGFGGVTTGTLPWTLTLDTTLPGPQTITAVATTARGTQSNTASQTFMVTGTPPAPTLTGLSPASVLAGGPLFTLGLSGTDFMPSTQISWNGAAIATTYVSSTSLTAVIPASAVATAGTFPVSVATPGVTATASLPFTVAPAPALTSLSPASATAGGPDLTVTLTGSGFLASSQAYWNSGAVSTTFISATTLTVVIPAAAMAATGISQIWVQTPGTSVITDLPFSVTAAAPSPSLAWLNPASATAEGAGFTLAVTGENFQASSQILWNGAALATTFVSAGSLTAAVPASALATAGTALVSVATPGAATTSTLSFTIAPATTLTFLSPAVSSLGAAGTALSVYGSGFLATSQVLWNGTALATTYEAASMLSATIPAADLASAGTFQVSVSTPGVGTTGTLPFAVVPTPVLTFIAPTSATAGGPALTLAVTGTGFVASSQVYFSGSALATTYVSSTSLTALVPASALGTASPAQVWVENASTLESAYQPFTVEPAPALSLLSPASAAAGSAGLTLAALGTGFQPGSQLLWNGTALATTFLSSSSLAAALPAGDLATAGTVQVSVQSPGSGATAALPFEVTPSSATPVLSLLSPASATAGGPALTLAVTGTGFQPASVVLWNGNTLTTTYVSPTVLTVPVPAGSLATAGVQQVAVATPGAGTSQPQGFFVETASATATALPTNDLVFDPVHDLIYASIPSSAGTRGNSIAVLDPVTGALLSTTYAGSEPGRLAIAEDASCLYVGLNGSSSVQRFTLPSLTADLTIPLGTSLDGGGNLALDLAVAPGAPHTLAVCEGSAFSSPSFSGLVLFDDAVPRPASLPGFGASTYDLGSIQWGSGANVLYGADTEDSGFDFYIMAVTPQGVAMVEDERDVMHGLGILHLDGGSGLMYADTGQVLDPATLQVLGTFPCSGPVAPDSGLGLAFFLTSNLGTVVQSFDLNHFLAAGAYAIPGSQSPFPDRLIRTGSYGLAVGGGGSPVYLVPASFLTSATGLQPWSAPAGGAGFTLTVQGTGFQPASQILWNGSAVPTTFVSPASLTAQIPAGSLANAGTVPVAVATPGLGTAAAPTFTVAGTPAAPTPLPTNDILWDPARSLIYASIPSSGGPRGNAIAVVDPATGGLVSTTYVGSEPSRLALSEDGAYLYVALNGTNAIQRLLLPSLAPDLSIPLGYGPGEGSNNVLDLQVAPGAPHTLAVSTTSTMTMPGYSGTVIFDDATPRPSVIPAWGAHTYYVSSLQWGSGATVLYGADSGGGGQDFYVLAVAAQGVAVLTDTPTFFTSAQDTLHLDPGSQIMYSDSGQVFNPATQQQLGTFGTSGPMVPDASLGLAFFLENPASMATSFTLGAFDLDHFTPASTYTLTVATPQAGTPTRLIRIGAYGLAVGGGGCPIALAPASF